VTPDELYKTILRSITQVRSVRAERQREDGVLPLADDALLDEMARNSVQALVGLLEPEHSCECGSPLSCRSCSWGA
jgi:hypothetical protein